MLSTPSKIKSQPLITNETFLSALQFSTCFSNTGWGKYSSLYFLEYGVTASQLGIMATISSIAKLIGYPTWGIVTDLVTTQSDSNDNSLNFKIMFISLLIASNLSIWFFYWNITHQIIFNTFWIMIVFRFIRSWLNSIWNLTDTITIKLIKDKSNYGLHRLHASIAWGVGCCIAGYLIDVYSMDIMFYYGTIINMFTILLVLFFMPHIPNSVSIAKVDDQQNEYHLINTNIEKPRQKRNAMAKNKSFILLLRTLYSMKRDHQFLRSLVVIQIYFIVMQIIERVLYIEMDQEFHMKRFNIGIITSISVIPEIPVFYYSKAIMNKFDYNTNKLVLVCHLTLFIRLFCHLFVYPQPDKEWIVFGVICAIQLLHGITFSLMFSVLRHYLHEIGSTHSTLELDIGGSVQSVLGIIIVLAGGFGTNLWLFIYDYYSPKYSYLAGCLTLVPSILILAANVSNRKKLFNTFYTTNTMGGLQ
eukprot:218935_1